MPQEKTRPARPRQSVKVTYALDEVLLLCLLAVLAGAETSIDIARFGGKKRDLLRRFRPKLLDHIGIFLYAPVSNT